MHVQTFFFNLIVLRRGGHSVYMSSKQNGGIVGKGNNGGGDKEKCVGNTQINTKNTIKTNKCSLQLVENDSLTRF